MRLFLHVGTHKTGTTSIQTFAARNRSTLYERGLYYPGFDTIGLEPRRSHLSLIGGLYGIGKNNPLSEDEAQSFFQSLRRWDESQESMDVLLSAENIVRLRPRKRRHFFRRLRAEFPKAEIIPVCALRRQDDLADSLYRTTVRSEIAPHLRAPDWETFIDQHYHMFAYNTLITQAVQILGSPARVIPYIGPSRLNSIPEFFQVLGVRTDDLDSESKKRNPSYDYIDCLVKEQLMSHDFDPRDLKLFDRFAIRTPLKTDYSFFSDQYRESFLLGFQEDNQALVSDYPSLASVLNPELPADKPVPPDEGVPSWVRHRYDHFLEFLASRRPENVSLYDAR